MDSMGPNGKFSPVADRHQICESKSPNPRPKATLIPTPDWPIPNWVRFTYSVPSHPHPLLHIYYLPPLPAVQTHPSPIVPPTMPSAVRLVRGTSRLVGGSTRGFHTSRPRMSGPHYPEGPLHNIPWTPKGKWNIRLKLFSYYGKDPPLNCVEGCDGLAAEVVSIVWMQGWRV